MGAALHQAERWGWVDRNVARQASPPTVRRERVQPPPPDVVRTVITAVADDDPVPGCPPVRTALTGARRGELCGLRWSDVDWSERVLHIRRSVCEVEGGGWAEKGTKTHAERRVALDDTALAVLRRHRTWVNDLAAELGVPKPADAFMFSLSPSGIAPLMPDHVSKATTRAASWARVGHLHLHQLRHFAATQLIAAGLDPVTVAGRLGHADASVTMNVYSHALESRDRAAAEVLGAALTTAVAASAALPTG